MENMSLINFLNGLEKQGILSVTANQKIQAFLDYDYKSVGKLFLTLTALIGALFVSAGIFSLIAHNWDDLPQHLQGFLSLVPSLAGLSIYYVAITKHANSVSWIEASSLFLMLMIGSSIALVSQVYHMDGDFDKFVIVWLCLTIPLFYIARASGIALLYLGLACKFLFPHILWGFLTPSDYNLNEKYYLFWVFFFAFLPHFYLALNKTSGKQGMRGIYLGWVVGIMLIIAMPFAVKGGFLWWAMGLLMGYYLIGKKFYANNLSSLGRPFQTITLYLLFHNLLMMTDDFVNEQVFKMDDLEKFGEWGIEGQLFWFLGLALTVITTYVLIKWREQEKPINRYVALVPFVMTFAYICYLLFDFADFDMRWLAYLVLNLYILGFGMNAMIVGSKNKNVVYMIYGLFITCILLWYKYFDLDISFWLKGLLFIGIGLCYLIVHYLSADDYEK